MQIPTPRTASETLLDLGRFHLASLVQTPDTADLAPHFQATQDELSAAWRSRVAAEEALITPRVAVRFGEWSLEQLLRGVALGCQGADNVVRGGPALKAVFASGLDAELRPRGAAQLEAAKAVLKRLRSQPAAAAVATEHGARLEAGIADFDARVTARKVAGETLGLARAHEDGAREQWVAAYDSNAGALRTRFPRQKARQDLYFDVVRTRSAGDDGDEDPDPAAPVA